MPENLYALRIQLRYYLRVKGVAITAADGVCCPHPGHPDTAFVARLIEDESDKGDRIQCDICAQSWDIFNVEALLSGVENNRGTFPRLIKAVKETLAVVLPDAVAGVDVPIAELSDEKLAEVKAAQRKAARETQSAKAEAKALAESDRARKQEAITEALPFKILGRADDGQFYFESQGKHIESIRTGAGITEEFIYLLADSKWWEFTFSGGRSRIDMHAVKNYLIAESNRLSFSTARLRGRGCWREE